MGVRGLQTYMEYHVPHGCKTVEIRKLVEEYKLQNRTNRVIIVVDAMSCIRKLYTDLFWVLNGQWKELLQRLEQFVSKFKSLGIELVFFFDGATIEAKRLTWVKRRMQNVEDVKNIFSNYLRHGRQPPDDLFQLPAGMATMIRFALKSTLDCNVITSIKECDSEIITFARQNKCLAILGQDSDYIISNTAPYLSINNLNLVSMTTILYDREAFADHIGLRLHQLPLMACLRGNDVVREELLASFHARICPRRNAASLYHLLPCLVSFIRIHPSPTNLQNARLIAKDVFGSPDKADFLMEALASYEAGNAETLVFSGDRLSKLIRERHVKTENVTHVYSLWNFGEYDSSCALEDFEVDNGLLSSALLYRPIRQRVYYIFKKSGNKNFETVKEWCVYVGNKLPAPDLVQCLPFELQSGGTTSLTELWLGNSMKVRWQTFFGCFNNTFNHQRLFERVPTHFIVLCCVLNHMIQNLNIEEWEIDSFIAQGVIVNNCDLSFLKKINIDRLNARAVHLSSIFMRGVSCSLLVLSTCSYPFPMSKAMPWNFFDGKLFHRCYLRAKQNERFVNHREKIKFQLPLFLELKAVVVENTKFEKQRTQPQ